ncbi:hypothetical protein [Pseudohalioglobus lutimaris]|uniref:hypothetical protein n=1 Tax=Pseudohalioglobus lutimaris TaxID=1737061 RepID=UPI0010546B6E|nr:hypothetical protein [Pseudohalioglobus lutimaris]
MSKAVRRYYRTILLGVAAMGVLIWSAIDQFGIAWEEMLELFLVTLSVIALVILAAGIAVGVCVALRRLFSNND